MEVRWGEEEEEQLARYLIRQVAMRAAGLLETECQQNAPRDHYFIGNLRPIPLQEDSEAPQYFRDLINKLSPVAFGAEFRVRPTDQQIQVSVQVNWNCYYRIFPTYQQQRVHQLAAIGEADELARTEAESTADQARDDLQEGETEIPSTDPEEETEDWNFEDDLTIEESSSISKDSSPSRRRRSSPRDSLFHRWKRIECQASGIVKISYDSSKRTWRTDVSALQNALDREALRAKEVVQGDSGRVRSAGAEDLRIKVPDSALVSKAEFADFCDSLVIELVPEWRWQAQVEVREGDRSTSDEPTLAVTLVNTSPMDDRAPNTEAYFFATVASFDFILGQVVPFELELVPRSFRYDRDLWGRGFNCAVVSERNNPKAFRTTHTPIHSQLRYSTRTAPVAPFAELARDPLPVLDEILAAMKRNLNSWDEEERRYNQEVPNWEEKYAAEFARDRQEYVSEIQRFERGVELIRTDPDVLLAFQLTNETFRRSEKSAWRLFQIVFLVLQIPGIAALGDPQNQDSAERSIVDIIYFPTGGGKTEAYLAVIVFHCFFDRLRGKAAGTTVWTRFPLRLLTLQQTQRVADVIGLAELVRREQPDPRLSGKVAPFAVGYFAGQEATPNELVEPEYKWRNPLDQVNWSKAQDDRVRQQWRKVVRCPSCRTYTVTLVFDPERARIFHRCTNPACAFRKGILPVYVIDNDIYRYLPSVIVGTIDKLAGVGNQRKLSLVFGQVDGQCPKHGYYKGQCCQKGCTERLQPGTPAGLSGPTLFVQDELHLLREGLGTFDSHYETFVQELLRRIGQPYPLKIIASSATIEAFERQVEHLYGRQRIQARIFPGLGPTLQRSFYAETKNYPQRLFVGVIPHNKTLFNAVLELIQYYHETIQDLQNLSAMDANPYRGKITPGSQTWQQLLDFYSTSLSYFLSNRDLSSVRTDLQAAVNPEMRQYGYAPLVIEELTGGTSTDAVTKTLEQLETPLAERGEAPTTILATSMVSHGVDVDRFNAMIFYGMPRQNAEYIQASSRVGRAHVGVVFNCMHPARERDQSHYAYFIKFHEFLGQLVEPVAINRWSKFSVQNTLPGLFMGVLLQLLANASGVDRPNKYYMLDFVKREVSSGRIRADDFIPFLEEAYQVRNAVTVGQQTFKEEIRLRVQQFLDQILAAGSQTKFISNALMPYKPMSSLREVDEQIEIELDDPGTRWGRNRL